MIIDKTWWEIPSCWIKDQFTTKKMSSTEIPEDIKEFKDKLTQPIFIFISSLNKTLTFTSLFNKVTLLEQNTIQANCQDSIQWTSRNNLNFKMFTKHCNQDLIPKLATSTTFHHLKTTIPNITLRNDFNEFTLRYLI